jgi:hypothetical protein
MMIQAEWWLLLASEGISSMLILVLNLPTGQLHNFNTCYNWWLSRMLIISINHLSSFESFHPFFYFPLAHTYIVISGSFYISPFLTLPYRNNWSTGHWWSLMNYMNGESMSQCHSIIIYHYYNRQWKLATEKRGKFPAVYFCKFSVLPLLFFRQTEYIFLIYFPS